LQKNREPGTTERSYKKKEPQVNHPGVHKSLKGPSEKDGRGPPLSRFGKTSAWESNSRSPRVQKDARTWPKKGKIKRAANLKRTKRRWAQKDTAVQEGGN